MPLNILIAEDDEMDQELIAQAVKEVGPDCTLRFVNNGEEVLTALKGLAETEMPSLIILDYNMPLMNGLETLKALQGQQEFDKIPKVVYSTSHHMAYQKDCLSANAVAYIKKGMTITEMKDDFRLMLKYCA